MDELTAPSAAAGGAVDRMSGQHAGWPALSVRTLHLGYLGNGLPWLGLGLCERLVDPLCSPAGCGRSLRALWSQGGQDVEESQHDEPQAEP